MWFESWSALGRIVIAGVIAYGALVLYLRISGKRTLAKMNAFDLVVTVAIGSTLSTVLVSRDVPIAEGLLALALLIVLQYIVAWTSVRSSRMRRIIKSDPVALMSGGELDRETMLRERISEDEVLSAMRTSGYAGVEEVRTVVLETDGSFSVIPHQEEPAKKPTVRDVKNAESGRGSGT